MTEPQIQGAPVQDQEWLLAVALFADHKLCQQFVADGLSIDDLVVSFQARVLVDACLHAAAQPDASTEDERQIHFQVAVTNHLRATLNDTDQYTVLQPALADSVAKVGSPTFTYGRAAAAIRVSRKAEQLRRNLQLVGSLVPEQFHLPVGPHDDWLATLQGRLVKTARMFAEIVTGRKDKPWREIVGDVRGELEAAIAAGSKEHAGRLSWSFSDADKILYPLRDGEMVVVGARPSVGKSALLVGIARVNARAKEKKRFLLFTYEDTPEQIATRMNQQETGISGITILDAPTMTQARFISNLKEIESLSVEVINASGMNIEQLCAKAELIHSINPVDGVGIDYLQLVPPTDRRMPREQQVSEVSRGSKGLATRIGRPVVVLAQLNRGSEHDNRPPRLSDLRESGAIEQDADRVVLLHRPAKNTRGEEQDVQSGNCPPVIELWMIQAKMRNGPTSTCRAAFVSAATKYTNLAQEPQNRPML